MITDRQGNSLPGATREAADQYDRAVEAFNLFKGDPIAFADAAIAAAPEFAMPHIFKAHLFGLFSEPAAIQGAKGIVEQVKTMKLSEREASHVGVLDLLLDGHWTAAAVALDYHNIKYPLDILGFQTGHLLDYYRANLRNLRDRIARALPKWSSDTPGYAVMLGMYTFGLEETGDYAKAEETGRRAIALQPLDCWAHHAVAHVMEMQGRPEDGVGWMVSRKSYWAAEDNFYQIHNWWHNALCHLELGQSDAVFKIYDEQIRKNNSSMALNLLDAASMLWRIQLAGHDVGNRWDEIASGWDQHADGVTYAFNDWHAIMAYLGAGRDSDVERLLSTFAGQAGQTSEMAQWIQNTGLPLIQGFTDFWRKDYESAIERLHKARYIANTFGGSNAQRDIIDWTLNEAAIRGGFYDIAEALANERLALRPNSLVNRDFLLRAQENVTQIKKAG